MMESQPSLLAIVELGGYPNFRPLYQRLGYLVEMVHSVRKAQNWLKKNRPAVVVTEFNFDPEFRDRMSNLESLLATLQRYGIEAKVIVFIAKEHRYRLNKVLERYTVFEALDYPIDESNLTDTLQSISKRLGE